MGIDVDDGSVVILGHGRRRTEHPNAIYHDMARSNQGCAIFRDARIGNAFGLRRKTNACLVWVSERLQMATKRG